MLFCPSHAATYEGRVSWLYTAVLTCDHTSEVTEYLEFTSSGLRSVDDRYLPERQLIASDGQNRRGIVGSCVGEFLHLYVPVAHILEDNCDRPRYPFFHFSNVTPVDKKPF